MEEISVKRWWFRNPKANHRFLHENPMEKVGGFSISTGERRISEPSTLVISSVKRLLRPSLKGLWTPLTQRHPVPKGLRTNRSMNSEVKAPGCSGPSLKVGDPQHVESSRFLGVSKNRGFPPKWMVKRMDKPYQNGWFGWEKVPLFLGKHPYITACSHIWSNWHSNRSFEVEIQMQVNPLFLIS